MEPTIAPQPRALPEVYSRPTENGRAVWLTKRLWELSAELPRTRVRVEDVRELHKDCWFDGGPATCLAVAWHAKRIAAVDLSYPIILASDGALMDGAHRVAKAWMLGQAEIDAVRFAVDPPPDYVFKE